MRRVAVAQPKPAELPLPGGRDGATVRIHPLQCAEATWPDAWPHREEGRLARLRAIGIGVPREEHVTLPIVAFLVEHPTAGPIVIDTGLSPTFVEDAKRDIGRLMAAVGVAKTFKTDASQTVPEQLRARGVDPADVRLVVLTHLHFDHASGISQFPGATFAVSGREWEAANGRLAFLRGYASGHFDRPFDFRTLDFDGPAAAPHSTFGQAIDLLGDGSLRAVYTPGHTHGHMSIVLRTAEREVLVVGDAAYTRRTIATGHLPQLMEDGRLFRRSLGEIQRYAKANPDALVIPGHDMEAWRELDAVHG